MYPGLALDSVRIAEDDLELLVVLLPLCKAQTEGMLHHPGGGGGGHGQPSASWMPYHHSIDGAAAPVLLGSF